MSKYKIVLQRVKEYPPNENVEGSKGSTVGSFIVYDTTENNKKIFVSCCIENAGPSTNESGTDKRIMPWTYKLYWTNSSVTVPKDFSERNLNCISLYKEDDDSVKKRRLHIHQGNNDVHTKGCLLLNDVDNLNGTGSKSEKACTRFYNLVDSLGIENFSLEVKEIN